MFLLENKVGKYLNQKDKKNDTITLALRKKNCYSVLNQTMKNITYSDEQINIFSLYNFFFQRLKDRPYWHVDENGQPILKQVNCVDEKKIKPIPNILYFHQEPFEKKHDPNKTRNKILWAKEILKERALTDEELKLCTKLISSSLMMLQTQNSKGNIAWFEGNAKGTARYNTIQRGKILDFVEEHVAKKYDCFFLTITCDTKKYMNRADAWETFLNKDVYKVTERLRKHYNGEYVATMESTAKGYPHAHIMMFVPHNTFPELKYYHNQQKIKKGSLFDLVSSSVFSPIFDLQAAKGKNLKWYLTKYIGKGIEESVFEIIKKDEELKKSDRKLLQEFIYLKLFNRRKVLMTRKGCKSKDVETAQGQKVSVSHNPASVSEQTGATKLRTNLTSLCTNSPFLSDKVIYSMDFVSFADVFNVSPERNNDVSDENATIFENKGRMVWNSRSFISDFVKFVLNPEDSPLNLKFYWDVEKDIYDKMLDGYNLDNDEEWLEAVTYVFDYYCTKILCENESYFGTLNQTETLSNVKRIVRRSNNLLARSDSEDLKVRYYSVDECLKYRRKIKELENKVI